MLPTLVLILIARYVSQFNITQKSMLLSINIVLVDNFYAGKRFTFSMDIRTYNCTGILLYVATPLYPDHFLLELIDGRV